MAVLALLTAYAQLSSRGIFASKALKTVLLVICVAYLVISVIYIWKNFSIMYAAILFFIFMIAVCIMPMFTHSGKKQVK